jgi:UDP-2,4-diacetamido-2,4,6-trideoxy-beta-L-altropyranose hydrolase
MPEEKIWIRADGNENIATGHIRRCCTIATELKRMGAEVVFVLSDKKSEKVLKSISGNEFSAIILDTDYQNMLSEEKTLRALLLSEKPAFLLIDSYAVEKDYFSFLKSFISENLLETKLGYIDDIYKFDYPVEVVINYDLKIPDNFYSAPCRLLGPGYTPIRGQFVTGEKTIKDKAETILVTSGGTDEKRVLSNLMADIFSPVFKNELSKKKFRVVLGPLFDEDYKKFLRLYALKNENVEMFDNITDLSDLMKEADLAISAAGTTLYELCASGVPTIAYSIAENQRIFVKDFEKEEIVKYSGDAEDVLELSENLQRECINLIEDKNARQKMSKKGQSLIDGKGATRIAEAIMKTIG